MQLFKPAFQAYLNGSILNQAKTISYSVSDIAPATFEALQAQGSKHLIIWSGASDQTIFNDPAVNYAFRAIHDKLHLDTGLSFSPQDEIKLGSLQSRQYACPFLSEIVRIEVAEQAAYYLKNGIFVSDQIDFMKQNLKNNNLFKGVLL